MNEETPTVPELRQWFIDYLADTFGKQILDIIPTPDDHEVGERVLFKLKHGVSAERKEVTQKDADDYHQILVKAVSGIEGAQVITDPLPVTSGLPYPRMVDVLDWSVAMEIPAKEYLASDTLLPKEGLYHSVASGSHDLAISKTTCLHRLHALEGQSDLLYRLRRGVRL